MPAQAQTTVWSAILTVDAVNTYFGCDNDDSGQDNCSLTSALSDDDFTFGGVDYTIHTLYWESTDDILTVVFYDSDGNFIRGPAAKTALKGLTLHVGNAELAINDASTIDDDSSLSAEVLNWSYNPSTDWTDNQQISVSIEGPPTAEWAQATYAVTETDSDQDLQLTINFSSALRALVNVAVSMTGGTATTTGPNADWELGACGFALSGATSATCRIGIKGDNVAEDAETIELTITGAATGAILIGTQSTTTITITDDDSPPAAPTDLQVAPGDAKLGLAWDAPSGTVTGYDVHYTSAPKTGNGAVTDDANASGSDPSAAWVAVSRGTESDPPTASQTISSLTNGTAYRVRVRAVNANGNSDWLHGTGTPAVPALPNVQWEFSTFSAGEGDGTLSPRVQSSALAALTGPLTYAAGVTNPATLSADLGTTPATFTLTSSQQFSSVAIPLVDDGLNEAHETFTVTIGAGTGYTVESPSVLTVTITDNDPPAAPGSLGLTAFSTRLGVSWQKPAGPVTGYQVRVKTTAAPDVAATTPGDPSTGWVTGTQTATSLAQGDLTNGTSYDVQVRATDGQAETGNGYGPWTATQSATPQLPAAPTNLQVTAGDTKLDLTWDAPSGSVNGYDVHYTSAPSTGNGAVTNDAAVQAGADSAGWVDASHSGTTASQEISSLTNGTAYRVRVRAKHATEGNSAWVFGTGTPTAATMAPAAPTNLQVSAGDAKLDLSWDAPSGTVTGYDVHFTSAPSTGNGAVTDDADESGNNPSMAWVAAASSAVNVSSATAGLRGLTNGTPYRVRVRAVNANGNSAWLHGTGTPQATALPDPVTNLSATPGNGKLTVTWTNPQGINGTFMRWRAQNTNTWLNPGGLSLGTLRTQPTEITNLTNGTTYEVGVQTYRQSDQTRSAWTTITATPMAPPPRVTLSASPNPVTEGSPVTVTARLSSAAASQVDIPVTVTDNTAEPADHGTLSSITILAGATSGSAQITTNHDAGEDNETFTVALDTANLPSSVTAGTPGSVQITIQDDEGAVAVHLRVDQPRVREGSTATLEVALTRGGASYIPPGTVRIPVSVVLFSAERGDLCRPYEQGFSVTVNISGGHGRSYGVVNLPTCHDADRDDETFTVALNEDVMPAGYVLGDRFIENLTIDDDDNDGGPPGGLTVTLSVAPNPVPEGGTVTVTARLQIDGNPLWWPDWEVIPLQVHRITSEPGDHSTLSSIEIPPGYTGGTATITTRRDGDGDHELFVVSLGELPSPFGPGRCPSVRVTISEGGVVVLDPCTGLSVDTGLVGLKLYP